jgi:hypothetical protein
MSNSNNDAAQQHEMVVAGANADADADHEDDGWEYPVNARRMYKRYMVDLMRYVFVTAACSMFVLLSK